MHVLVTGSTGYIGSAIVAALVRSGHRVTGLTRSDAGDARVRKLGAEPARGALGRLAELTALMAGHDALVHAAMDYGLGAPADREAIDAMIAAARLGNAVQSLVYTSGVWVLGPTQGPADDETSRIDRPAAAVAWRPGHERLVLEAARGSLTVAVVRPGNVFGEKRGLVSPWFEQATREGAARIVGDGRNRWTLVHRDDLGELYRLLIEKRARGIFHGVDGASPTQAEAAAAASRAVGKGAVRPVPLEEARKTMGPMADALAMDQVVVSVRGVEVGWKPKHPPFVQDAPAAYAEWRG